MRSTSLAAAAALFLAVVTVASAKSWHIAIDHPAKAGNTTLPAGNYTIKLNKTQSEFIAADSGKKYDVPVKLVNADRKYHETAVVTTQGSGTELIESIQLGGTSTEMEFTR